MYGAIILCNMKTIAITIEDDVLQRIDQLLKIGQTAGNRSQFIREAVRDRLVRIERSAEEERERELIHRHRRQLEREALALIRPGGASGSGLDGCAYQFGNSVG